MSPPSESATPLPARSHAEAHLYMDLHPCRCGEPLVGRQSSVVARGDDLVMVYTGTCAGCGAAWRFEFTLPEEMIRPSNPPRYGGDAPSAIIDAGQWLAVAEHMRDEPGLALAAIDEVLKFIPPGQDRVPEAAVFTPDGRARYRSEPSSFQRSSLEALRGSLRS